MRTLATLGLLVATAIHTSAALAADPPAPAKPGEATGPFDLEVYGTLLPFFENVGTSGATRLLPGQASPAPNLVPASLYTGINHDRRFRLTSGTSHLGFRGGLPIAGEWLRLIWQVESPTPIDGEGPATWASRNSHVGFSGLWGTITYGNWDTPMKWVTTTSVNPIKGGYVADMVPIIGAPGAQTPAINPEPTLLAAQELVPNRAGFFRHEVNTVQYWSPTVAGFSLRFMFAANEHRVAGVPGQQPAVNPYLLSGYVGWDNEWLRLRYSAELHNDYFGLVNLGGPLTDNSTLTPHSRDVGHLALASVTINGSSPYKTRLVVTGDYLSYHIDDVTANGTGSVTDLSRFGFYGLLQQHFGKHSVWGAYGQATEGKCALRGSTCVTAGLGAMYGTLGYLFNFTNDAGVYLIGYGLFNDTAARYAPFPIMDSTKRSTTQAFLPNLTEIAPGADTTGIGIGFVYSFNAKLFGAATPPPPSTTPAPQPQKAVAPPKEPAPATEAAPKGDSEPEEEEEETGAPPPAAP